MSTNDQITRIRSAKAALKAAIADKGVNVPDSALIDGYPEYVKDIDQIDLSDDTVTPADVRTGVTFHAADGEQYVGELEVAVSRLPAGYTELEYIESTGTQYIDTGFKPNGNTRVVMDCVMLTGVAYACPFGARHYSSKTTNAFWMFFVNNNTLRSDYNTSENQNFSVSVGTRLSIDKNKGTTTINGTTKSYSNATFQCDYNLLLFAANNNGKVDCKANMKLYACQIYDNGTLIRDYVPCQSANGVYGLFDLVENRFYALGDGTSAGTVYTGTAVLGSVMSVSIDFGISVSSSDYIVIMPMDGITRGAADFFVGARMQSDRSICTYTLDYNGNLKIYTVPASEVLSGSKITITYAGYAAGAYNWLVIKS